MSFFGSTLGQSTAQPQNQVQQQTESTQQPTQSAAYFDALLEKNRRRAEGDEPMHELPSLQLGLGDLRDRIRRLAPTTADRAADGKAHYLLATSGVEPGAAVRDLKYFDTQPLKQDKAQPVNVVSPDIEGYLANIQTQTTLSMIQEGLARSVRDFDSFLEENVSMEWDAQRKRIYRHFGIRNNTDGKPEQPTKLRSGSVAEDRGGFGRSRRSKAQSTLNVNGSKFGLAGAKSLQRSVIGSVGPLGASTASPFADVQTQKRGTDASSMSFGRIVRDKENRFADKVQSLNKARLQKQAYPILHEFGSVGAQDPDEYAEHILAAYKALIEITGEGQETRSQSAPNALKERQFAQAYMGDGPQSQAGLALRKRILNGTLRHLEKQFFVNMENTLAKNPREAALGGVPDVLSKVKAYVRFRANRRDLASDNTNLQMLENDHVWAVIFYLLRTGHVAEAAKYVEANSVAFRTIDRHFASYIVEYSRSEDRRLPPDMQNRINNEFNQRSRIAPDDSMDPYRMACYKVIGRCELSTRLLHGLPSNVPDWVWLQFALAREVNLVNEQAGDVYDLSMVQHDMKTIVSKYFGTTPSESNKGLVAVSFYLQIIAGLFEEAIKFLYEVAPTDALHVAVTLAYYGLLRVSDFSSAAGKLLTFTSTELPQLNFAQMIGFYTQDFRTANVVAAVDYLTLICLNGDLKGELGSRQVAICHQGLRELVLESREFAVLLGDVRLDGQRVTGAIEERMRLVHFEDSDDFIRTVTIQAASIADDNGRITDAVLLYDLAGEYDHVIDITNRALSEAIAMDMDQEKAIQQAQPPAEEPQQKNLSISSVEDPVKLAQSIIAIYNNNPVYHEKISQSNKETCGVLLRMNEAKGKVAAGDWTTTLDVST
jgi:nuclear pore complex protein Nup93